MAQRKKLVLTLDFNDEVRTPDDWCKPDDIRAKAARCRDAGVDRILWRVTCLGTGSYRSKHLWTADVCDAADIYDQDWLTPQQKQSAVRSFAIRAAAYRRILRTYDPPEVARSAFQAAGIEFYIWWDLFDEWWPGCTSKFLHDNPRFQWTGRDGQFFRGVRSYAFPESRLDQMPVLDELLAYQPDGLYLCTSCHPCNTRQPLVEDCYGYEQPVAEEFLRRYGTDIRTADDFDKQLWHDLKGECVTELYRMISAKAKARNVPLLLGTAAERLLHHPNCEDRSIFTAKYTSDWPLLVDEGVAQGLSMGDYEENWRRDEFNRTRLSEPLPDGQLLCYAMPGWFRSRVGRRAELLIFTGWLSKAQLPRQLEKFSTTTARLDVDGMILHEHATIESTENGYSHLAAARKALGS